MIYLVEKTDRYDLSSLKAYGEIGSLTDRRLDPFNVPATKVRLREGLKNFDPTEDYLCLTGNLLSVSLMLMVAYAEFDTFRILVFDARSSNYKERMIHHG